MSLLNSASLCVTPNAYKEGTLYSVIPNTTLGDMTVVRATTATRVNSAGLIELVPYNFIVQSSNLGSWSNAGVTITTGITDAFGGNNAVTMSNISSGNLTDYIAKFSNSMGLPTGTQINYSFYLKGSGTIGVQIERGVSGDYFVSNNIATLTNNWVRYDYSYTIPIGVNAEGFHIYISNLTGTTATSVDICFPQVSYGSTAKDYFPTTTRLNIPRLDYSNGSCPSLLVEPQRTNLALYSEQFDNAAWTKGNGTITANATTSPDGTANADKFAEDTSTDAHYFGNDTATATSGQSVTFTIFAKASERSWIAIRLYSGASSIFGWYNIGSGTLGTIGAGGTGTIENYSNGWYRCSLTITMASNSVCLPYAFSSKGTITFTGTSGSGFFAWGAQAEIGSYATSYIPTTSAAVTRNADQISKTGISSLIGQTEGTLFADAVLTGKDSTNGSILFATDKVSTGAIIRVFYTSANALRFDVFNGTSFQCLISAGAYNVGDRVKVAGAYKNNDFVMYVNGTQIGTDTSGTVPATDTANINTSIYGDTNGSRINSAILFPTRLTNAELASLTTI